MLQRFPASAFQAEGPKPARASEPERGGAACGTAGEGALRWHHDPYVPARTYVHVCVKAKEKCI